MVSIIIALVVCLCSSSVVLGVAAMVANSAVALRREQSRLEADKMRYAIEYEHARTETFHALKDVTAKITVTPGTKVKSLTTTESLVDQIYERISRSPELESFRRKFIQ